MRVSGTGCLASNAGSLPATFSGAAPRGLDYAVE